MPSLKERQISEFPSNVETADIHLVDFELLANGDKEESQRMFNACTGFGFFHLKNHHIDSNFMFDLANDVFELPYEEKMKYDMGTTGKYFGYKQSGASYVDSKGTPDKSQFYNVSKDDILRVKGREPLEHPEPVERQRERLETFMKSCHGVILVIIQVLEERLGLEKGTLTRLHDVHQQSGDQARLTHAPPVGSEVITLGEHTDFGSVTVLFNQLGGLQVLNPNSRDWLYIRPERDCAIINLGDALVKMVDEKLYSGVHRVVGPPGDQAKDPRHSVVYFSRPNGSVKLSSVFSSSTDHEAPTADEWISQRVRLRSTQNFQGAETWEKSKGTEHHKEKADVKPSLDKPAAAVEAV